MSEQQKTTIRVSPSAARYVQPNTPREERLKAARGEADIPVSEIPLVMFFLSRDRDPEISSSAVDSLRRLPESLVLDICGSPDTHPRILELLARLHCPNPLIDRAISLNPQADEKALGILAEQRTATVPLPESGPCPDVDNSADTEEQKSDDDGEKEEDEEYLSKYQLSQEMSITEKIKMALTGDKEWRMLLIKDTNKLISGAVIKNPRLTEAEVLAITKSSVNNDEILREISGNKEWIKNYQIRKALVENHKTPLPSALRFLSGLTDKDLAGFAKSKNVSTVISTQAKRLLLNKKKEK